MQPDRMFNNYSMTGLRFAGFETWLLITNISVCLLNVVLRVNCPFWYVTGQFVCVWDPMCDWNFWLLWKHCLIFVTDKERIILYLFSLIIEIMTVLWNHWLASNGWQEAYLVFWISSYLVAVWLRLGSKTNWFWVPSLFFSVLVCFSSLMHTWLYIVSLRCRFWAHGVLSKCQWGSVSGSASLDGRCNTPSFK